MYQLIMTVILIATFAAVTVMGVNTMKPSAMTRITDAEVVVSEHLRLSLALQAYKRANGDLPETSGWIEAIDPYLNAEPRAMPEAVTWAYLRLGDEFSLCARGANAWSSDALKTVSCFALPDRWKQMPDVLIATPGRTYLPGELPTDGLSVEAMPYRIQLRNSGTSSVTIGEISLDVGTSFRIEGSNCPGPLAAGATCVIEYVVVSGPGGAGADTLTVFADAI